MARNRTTAWCALSAMLVLLSLGAGRAGALEILHEFTGATGDGATPYGSLLREGTVLYGMTRDGGSNDLGVVFKMNTDGTGYTPLLNFGGTLGSESNGAEPYGRLVSDGSVLYGMTRRGGDGGSPPTGRGTIFKLANDGTNADIIHHFTGGTTDGWLPYGSPVISGTKLYGMTSDGGLYSNGVIYGCDSDGTGYTLLHHFGSVTDDGAEPHGSLYAAGGVLYGMTRYGGGTSGKGTVFSLNAGGGGYQVLHRFSETDGEWPDGDLALQGDYLYGMTSSGGVHDGGVVFRIRTTGADFEVLHDFGDAGDGSTPHGSLTVYGSSVIGVTQHGGTNGNGVIFQMGLDGSGYSVLYSFQGGDDGDQPYYALPILDADSRLYGMTTTGGATGTAYGVVWRTESRVPEPATLALLAAGGMLLVKRRRTAA